MLEKKLRTQRICIALMVALIISLFALVGVRALNTSNNEVVVTNNVITNEQLTNTTSANSTTLSLNSSSTSVNQPFEVSNMFPGDSVTKDFSVKVSHKKNVTLYFKAEVRSGYEKLAEVLKCKVTLGTGETLYDGLMKDMPDYVSTVLKTDSNTTTIMDYHITAYLDTSVGNEYQEKDLIADFKWWVPTEEQPYLSPNTGDYGISSPNTWIAIGAVTVGIVLFAVYLKKRKDGQDERG